MQSEFSWINVLKAVFPIVDLDVKLFSPPGGKRVQNLLNVEGEVATIEVGGCKAVCDQEDVAALRVFWFKDTLDLVGKT